jgi:hypothetical protein
MAYLDDIKFTSTVSARQRTSLEALVFFNSCQDRVMQGIVDAIEVYGTPEIIADRQGLRVRLSGCPDAQTLFALDARTGKPVGIAIYTRSEIEYLTVLHVGIAHEFASGGTRANEQLLLRLLRELRRCGLQMKGVRRVQLYYLNGRASGRSENARASHNR